MRPFSIVVAMDDARGIGKQNQLPWRLPGDLKAFKKRTETCTQPGKQNVVLMGRKTWDSIPKKFRPLSNRVNVVLSRKKGIAQEHDFFVASSFEQALLRLESEKFRPLWADLFVIGGAEVYAQALKQEACRALYITHLKNTFECDRFFPSFRDDFEVVSRSDDIVENGMTYFFAKYKRLGGDPT